MCCFAGRGGVKIASRLSDIRLYPGCRLDVLEVRSSVLSKTSKQKLKHELRKLGTTTNVLRLSHNI